MVYKYHKLHLYCMVELLIKLVNNPKTNKIN